MSTSDLKSLIEAKKALMQQRAKYSPHEFQAYGYFLAENLNDLAHRSIYIAMAKKTPRQLLDKAYHETKEAATKLTGKSSQAKFFMWKVKQLRLEYKANNPDELVDIVDENDEVVGVVSRKEANSNPNLIHRHLGLLIYDEQNRILFQQRSLYKDLNPGKWSWAVSGHLEAGKKPESGIKKETREELGVSIKNPIFIEKFFKRSEKESNCNYVFVTSLKSDVKIKFNKSEVNQVAFLTRAEFLEKQKNGEGFSPSAASFALRFWAGELDDRIGR